MYVFGALAAVLGLASGALAVRLANASVEGGVLRVAVGDILIGELDERWGDLGLAAAMGGAALLLALATGLFVAGYHRSREVLVRRIAGDTAHLEARNRLLRERVAFLEDRVGLLERTRAELEERKEQLEREVAELDDAAERRRAALRLAQRGKTLVVPEAIQDPQPET